MTQQASIFPYVICDAHHHLWNLNIVHYPWLAAKGVMRFFGDPTPIQKDYLVAGLREDIGNLPVEQSVHIEVGAIEGQHFLESQTAQAMSDKQGLANGIVAFVDLRSDDLAAKLDEFAKLPNLRGIRQIVGRSPTEDKVTGTGSLIHDPKWLRGLSMLAKRGLSFDLQLIPDQMADVVEVLRQVPELNVALCHCGSPWYKAQVDEQGWQVWLDGLQAFSELPNTVCKVSGLTMFDHDWTVDSLSPIVETVINTFGAERVMFGSNFPVDKLHATYHDLWHAYLSVVDNMPNLTAVQKQAMFADNCRRFYRL